MKVGLFSALLPDHEGGGERYLLTIAEHLSIHRQCAVDLVVHKHLTQSEKTQLVDRHSQKFKLDLSKVNVITGPFAAKHNSLERYLFTKKYDAFMSFTDGAVYFAGSNRNVLHIQIPLKQGPQGLLNRFKLRSWNIKVTNSYFTKRQVEKNWGITINFVHWGAVNAQDFKPGKKTNTILHVGRFFTGLHCKRQDVMVDMFKRMIDHGLKNWELVLVGSIDPGSDNQAYAQQIALQAKGYPIKFFHHITFPQLQKQYATARIYWHATGYGLDENVYPEKVEHLGLSTVEAMSAGAVPVVINKGGQPEIVTHNSNGLLWESKQQGINETLRLIKNSSRMKKLSQAAKIRAQDFSKAKFQQTTDKIFGINHEA